VEKGVLMKKSLPVFFIISTIFFFTFNPSSLPYTQEIISNQKIPQPKDGRAIRFVFEEDLSIGAEYGEEEYMFGNRVYFNVDEDGYIYVNDWDKKFIRKFDAHGKYILTIGRRGQGPGEFQNVWHPRFDKNGNMYVSDIVGSRRISIFDRGGTFLELIRVPIDMSNITINSQGNYLGFHSMMIDDPQGSSATTIFGLFDSQFQLLEELHKTKREFKPPSGRGADSRAQFLADILDDEAFTPTLSFFITEDDTTYLGYPESYEIKVYSPEGKLQKLIRREYDPVKVSKKHIQNFIDYQENEFFRFAQYPEDIKKKVFQLIEYPKHKPAYETFTLMENGWIFVIVDHIDSDYTLIDLFDRQGKYISQFEAKIPIQNLLFKNGKAYALAVENDYRYVKRYRFEIQEILNDK
jgi:hypothetical protein